MFSEQIFGADLPTWAIFAELLLCGLLVTLVGARLTGLADVISDRLNLGKAWIGLLLLAGITSLPEVVTGGTSVLIGQPDLAFGNIFGSCMFNVAIIVILDWLLRSSSVFGGGNLSHSLSSSMGIVLMSLAVVAMTMVDRMTRADAALPITPETFEAAFCVLIAFTYLACIRLTYRFERKLQADGQLTLPAAGPPGSRRVYLVFGMLAVMLVALTVWLTRTGDVLQDHPIRLIGGRSLGATFVGAFFLAAATSLPEIVTSITAVRIGHLDLALGNIFGSNMFNIFVIPILKIFSLIHGDRLLMSGDGFSVQAHTLTGLFAILITAVAVGGLVYRTKRRLFHFGFDSIIIGVIYVVGMYLLLS